MANANLFMFGYAHMYVLRLTNEKYVMHMYIAYVQKQNWLRQRHTHTHRERERERNRDSTKHRGLYCTFFLWKGVVCKKQDHSLQSSVWVKTKHIF